MPREKCDLGMFGGLCRIGAVLQLNFCVWVFLGMLGADTGWFHLPPPHLAFGVARNVVYVAVIVYGLIAVGMLQNRRSAWTLEGFTVTACTLYAAWWVVRHGYAPDFLTWRGLAALAVFCWCLSFGKKIGRYGNRFAGTISGGSIAS